MLTKKGIIRASRGYKNLNYMDIFFLILLHRLSNIKITKHFNYNSRFNSVFLGDNLPRVKDGAYVVYLDDKESKGTHCERIQTLK